MKHIPNRTADRSHIAMQWFTGLFGALLAFAMTTAAMAQSNSGSHSQFEPPIPDELNKARFAELLKPDALPELQLGSATAPVAIVGYTSVSCGLCGHFQRNILPKLTAKYIDTGKARLIVRAFPLDRVAAAGAMLTRCVKPVESYKFHAQLLEQQSDWLMQKGQNLRDGLVRIFRKFGGTGEAFDACLGKQDLLKNIMDVRNRAHGTFGVVETPTFFVNGKPLVGPRSIDEFEKVIRPMLKSQQ